MFFVYIQVSEIQLSPEMRSDGAVGPRPTVTLSGRASDENAEGRQFSQIRIGCSSHPLAREVRYLLLQFLNPFPFFLALMACCMMMYL